MHVLWTDTARWMQTMLADFNSDSVVSNYHGIEKNQDDQLLRAEKPNVTLSSDVLVDS